MYKIKPNRYLYLIPFAFFCFYLLWLFRAYSDVAWMDQINLLAGNINHMYSKELTIHDFYYRPPFLQCISILLVFLNCKLFAYNTTLENVLTGIFLLLIAFYFIKSQRHLYTGRLQFYFAILCSLIVFGLHKWQMSLWGSGFGTYMVVFFVFVSMNIGHKYYLNELKNNFAKKYFIPLFIALSLLSILEFTAFFLSFQVSMLLLLLVNYRIFRDKIDVKKWRTVLLLNIFLLFAALFINYLPQLFSVNAVYHSYEKVALSRTLSASAEKLFHEPWFVIKFFLISNTGNLIGNEMYNGSELTKTILPFIGLFVIALYGWALYIFIRKKKLEYIYSVNLIVYTLVLYCTIVLGRLYFNDVFYGASSRYSAATFSGILGIVSILFNQLQKSGSLNRKRIISYYIPLLFICVCYILTNRHQWKVAPFRKMNYEKWILYMKSDSNIRALQGDNIEIIENARQVMIKNHLNVFKPENKLNNTIIDNKFSGISHEGFYKLESSKTRWTNGNGAIFLPNLYTPRDSFVVNLQCYVPYPDTPLVVLNNNLYPSRFRKTDGGFEYYFDVCGQNVFFKANLLNRAFVPHLLNKDNTDERKLGFVFNSLTFFDERKK